MNEIDPKRHYTCYEIVQNGWLPNVTSTVQCVKLVHVDAMGPRVLDGARVPRGKGVQYKIRGANIIKWLANNAT